MNVGRKQTCAFSPLIAALVEVSQENKGGEAVYFDPCFSVMLLLFYYGRHRQNIDFIV